MWKKMEFLRIGKIWFPVTTLGYGRRFGIWLQGCTRNCPNCISPELKSSRGGSLVSTGDIKKIIEGYDAIDGLTISGGEPFDQSDGLWEIVEWFSSSISSDILIYTGYTLEELRNKKNNSIDLILNSISVLIDGTYIDELNDGKGLRGSSNQKIYIWKNQDRYINIWEIKRKIQGVLLPDNSLWMIGIPPLKGDQR